MTSPGNRPGDRHTHPPVAYRVPADLRPLLQARMKQTGRGASAIITEALRRHLTTAASDPGEPPP
jgi:predicted DNA-binding protein